ncbi:FHA domain-containing protein [Cellulomonas sp. NPDC089187]|uniref:FHA domain-containing protein n=1 Tax=Cellulomonas sp. NPDC089187 TaxID=3154970 RepID=UPI00344A50A6
MTATPTGRSAGVRAFRPVPVGDPSTRVSGGDRSAVPVDALLAASAPPQGLLRAWWAIDGLLVFAAAALGLLHWSVGLIAVLVVVAVEVDDLTRTGRTVGHRLLGLRSVDVDTALPPRRGMRHWITVDLRAGADPLALFPLAVPRLPGGPDLWSPRRAESAAAVAVLVDDGTVLAIAGPTVLGRSPHDPTHAVARVTDLSRTLSRNHVLLDPVDAGVRVTDLGSANGTAVAGPGEAFRALEPHRGVVVPLGARIAIGERVLLLADPTAVATGVLS